ncbi:MAG: NAD(P)/FAD-dependent oxidoreductase [Pseudomonadota bacterium]
MSERYDSLIIGGGHNGLVCAATLAQAGQQVLVLEAREQVGGAAVTEEFAPGFKVSSCAHLLYQLHPQVVTDLKLKDHGLTFVNPDLATIAIGSDGDFLRLHGPEIWGDLPEGELAAYQALRQRLLKMAAALRPLLTMPPPRLGTAGTADRHGLLKMGWTLRKMGQSQLRDFLRIAGMNVADLLEDELSASLLKGALAWDGVVGSHAGPRSPGTVLSYLYRLTGQVDNRQGAIAQPVGGMGTVTRAMLEACQAAGVTVQANAPVGQIKVQNDRACGVVLTDGREIRANAVISNADPRHTFLDLLGARHLDTGFVTRIRRLRAKGNVSKLHLALDGTPSFTGLSARDLAGRLLISPSIDYLEEAFNPAKYGEFSRSPAMEITLPSLQDASLAPGGKQVLSATLCYTPYALKGGWEVMRERLADQVIDQLELYAPGIKAQVIDREILTPRDLEMRFGMAGGHWHHAEMAIDQLLMMRPVPGAAQYATPVAGLYLCGAGSHPGGGVMGVAGMNAAHTILNDKG